MFRNVSVVSLLLLLPAVLVCTGCAGDRILEPDRPDMLVEPVHPGPIDTPEPPPEPPVITGRLSDSEKQQIIQASLISLMRVSVSSEENLHLADGKAAASAARDAVISKLAQLTFQVIDGMPPLPFAATESQQSAFRRSNNCNLAFLLKGEAKQADKFGNFYSFGADLEGKVLNLTTHQVIARKSLSKRGERNLDQRKAAEDAMRAAAADMTTYLTDEVARLWEATSLVKMRLEVGNLDTIAQADDIRNKLQRRLGVFYVSMESWSAKDEVAVYEVLARFDTQRFLAAYVEELRGGGLEVKSYEQHGEVIKAERRRGR